MNRKAFKDELLARYNGEPQKRALAENAIDTAFGQLDELAKLGYQLQIVFEHGGTQGTEWKEFPKHMYHSMFPGGLQVESAEMQSKMEGQGWSTKQDGVPQAPAVADANVDDSTDDNTDNNGNDN